MRLPITLVWREGVNSSLLLCIHRFQISSYTPFGHHTEVLKDNHPNKGSLTKYDPEEQITLKYLRLKARSVSKLTWEDHLLILTDTINVKRSNKGIRSKRMNKGLNKRKDTLIKKAYELGKLDGIDVALIIYKHS